MIVKNEMKLLSLWMIHHYAKSLEHPISQVSDGNLAAETPTFIQILLHGSTLMGYFPITHESP